jgi:uncharacterized protein
MKSFLNLRLYLLTAAALAPVLLATAARAQEPPPQYPGLPSETPAHLTPSTQSFDYKRRDEMIPMRDGVRLHTVILIPKGAKNAAMLLTRTPYNASAMVTQEESSHLGPSLFGYDNPTDVIVQGGYIRVIQDVRGKYGSEGDYVMNRPLHGPLNPTPVDNATDTYDTIDWLVKNIPESNGKVGILGISYDGFTTLMSLVNPHPALKVAIPMNPMVDGWMGDDWFHYGAFREQNMPYIYEQDATRSNSASWWHSHFDDYDEFLEEVNAGEMGKLHGLEQVGFWRKILQHPAYDSWWREQAMDKILASQPLKVPTMLVDSLWDQEDIYGAIAVYKAIKPRDRNNEKVFLVLGPWHHGQEIEDGSTLGAINFHSDTALYFREHILAPFLAHYLRDHDSHATGSQISPVYAYETGTDHWLRLSSWPSGCPRGCTIHPTSLYLNAGLKLSYSAPKSGDTPYDEYVSDPAKPVPFRIRPVRPIGYDALKGFTWARWLVDDHRQFSTRPDVLVYVSDVLETPEKISGQPVVHLVASTSGRDSDWVVKLIDLYTDEVAEQQGMGGYQLMISTDIFRGRYRESFKTPHALAPNKPLLYHFLLPTADHIFLPGHRIMVQIQSSWFPLYDRNPQTFVPNIFWAKLSDYRKAEQRVYHAPGEDSYIELPLVSTP